MGWGVRYGPLPLHDVCIFLYSKIESISHRNSDIYNPPVAFTIGGLLALLYLYIFVLIQMETYALLAGSLGLFIILAVIMYYSQKINWNGGMK